MKLFVKVQFKVAVAITLVLVIVTISGCVESTTGTKDKTTVHVHSAAVACQIDSVQGRKAVLRTENELNKFDNRDGFWSHEEGVSLVNLDLRGYAKLLEKIQFDNRTEWPNLEKLPEGFDPVRLLEEGKNPGLGIRNLHKQGIDGRGVGIAILDQPLLRNHTEYVDRIVQYEGIGVEGMSLQMHGPPIVSIAVGKTCGVAPRASVFYYAMPMTAMPDNQIYCDIIDKIIKMNENESVSEKIRVVNISTGTFAWQDNFDLWKKTLKKAERHGIRVVTCAWGWLRYDTVSRIPGKDPDEPNSYLGEDFDDRTLLIPTANRTTASFRGPNVYTHWTESGRSWGAAYLSGLAALAFQVNPDLQPETIVEQLVKTATHTKAGPVVNPRGFIESIRPAPKKP